MTRLGGTILALIVLAAIGFASMVSFGPNVPQPFPMKTAATRATPPSAELASEAALAIPVAGVTPDRLTDTWGVSRSGGARAHEAIDIMAPTGTPVTAAGPGRVEKLFNSDAGGTTLYVRSPDRAWSHYYAHLAGYAPGLHEGMAVERGTLLGFVGDTGNAGADNTHLHFAIARMRSGDDWHQGEPVNPYPLLAGSAVRR
ncbi:M23 family metallopeptidase [Sphingomonas jeddahensis]|uniref:L-Ala--D-Glu endopeptidase n=1 Tax=Sphingomonas jeddahensis TaxID=1915074 RepID=A0A1V2ET37_9SPHN|nr:M23 family metallopeptidase [Sphingomonas jeddahensis]ONF95468.1 L-Ala--D-Glu endopeptidase precursor [Sphingomonas jeddahensis]